MLLSICVSSPLTVVMAMGVVEVIYLLGSVVKFTLAAHLPLSVFYGTLPAKVELKKSHLGKQSRTECALRHLPCQSEFAERSKLKEWNDLVERNNWQNSVNWAEAPCEMS